jgi:hypothetical protein
MTDNLVMKTASAYSYPLLIKNLFLAPIAENPEQGKETQSTRTKTFFNAPQTGHFSGALPTSI